MGFIWDIHANKVKLNALSLLLGSIHFLVKQRILWTIQMKLATSERLVFILDLLLFVFLSILLFDKYMFLEILQL